METFTEPKPLVANPRFAEDRRRALAALNLAEIDEPIVDVVESFAGLPHCFTLQCCHGHFLSREGQDIHTPERVPDERGGPIRYRIAYVALCIDDTPEGRALHEALSEFPASDPGYIQFGSAEWFWERHVNTYALQVEPERYKTRDEAMLERAEARRVEQARDVFYVKLRKLLERETKAHRGD